MLKILNPKAMSDILETIIRFLRNDRKARMHFEVEAIQKLNSLAKFHLINQYAPQIKNEDPLAIEWLDLCSVGIFSQHGEDGIIFEILKVLEISSGVSIEIGAGHNGGNTGFLCSFPAFNNLLVEQDSDLCNILSSKFNYKTTTVINSKVSPSNINDIVKARATILSIDIDSLDYWVLDSLESWPSILVAEYNASFGLSNLVINPKYNFTNELEEEKNMQLYGASLVALTNLAKKHGLELVYCDQSGTNAFFVSKNSLTTLIPKQPHEVFRDSARSLKFKSRRLNHSAYIERGILVEV